MRSARTPSLIALVAIACSAPRAPVSAPPPPSDAMPAPRDAPVDAPPAVLVPPGLRLPDDVVPTAYRVRFEVDPEAPTFHGHVDIDVTIARATDHVWLNAVGLALTDPRYSVGGAAQPLVALDARTTDVVGFRFGRALAPGPATLHLDFAGALATTDLIGLFRQRNGGRWYLYSQLESHFARTVVPSFDEPRWKTPWTVTIVAPRADRVFSNAPIARTTARGDRIETEFAPTPPMPAYLLAIAVGPFEIVEIGAVGRNRVPARIIVPAGHADLAAVAAAQTGPIVAALEAYFDMPLPLAKLDQIAVPQFFGAMENVGLVTFESHILFDESDGEYGFARVAAHELVHQWFGNLVTPQWWDELWLSEAFASFLGDKIAELAGETRDPILDQQLARAEALAADASTPLPLRRRVVGNSTVDDTFDEIAYQKGASVLAMFEAYMEPDKFRAALRELLRANAHGSITTDSFVAAVRTIDASAADAVRTYATHAGAPIVEMELACDAGANGAGTNGAGANSAGASSSSGPRVIATARDGAVIPVCVRYPGAGGPSRACAIVSARTEIPLAATACPAWIAGNANGTGYYEVVAAFDTPDKHDAKAKQVPGGPPDTNARLPRQLDKLLPAERMALGADAATAMTRGDLSVRDALALVKSLLASKDPYARLGAVSIVRAVDPIVDDTTRPLWIAWLAKRLPPIGKPAKAVERELVNATAELTPLPGGVRAFDKVVALARSKQSDDQRTLLSQLGGFGSSVAPRIVALLLDRSLPATSVLQSLFEQLARGDTRTAAWIALRAKLSEVMAQITPRDARDLVSATASLCDATVRAQVAAAFTPRAADIPDGATTLAAALASIDRCVTRAKTAGDLKIVLRAL